MQIEGLHKDLLPVLHSSSIPTLLLGKYSVTESHSQACILTPLIPTRGVNDRNETDARMTNTGIVEELGGNIPKPNIDKMKTSVPWSICLMSILCVLQNPVKVWVKVRSQCELRRVLLPQRYMSTSYRTIPEFVPQPGPKSGSLFLLDTNSYWRAVKEQILLGSDYIWNQGDPYPGNVGSEGWRLYSFIVSHMIPQSHGSVY